MSSHLISLAWDGHHKTLVSVFEKLLVNSHFVDCTIAAEGEKIKAHKEVLSAFSPFFKLIFREETENNPTVIISGITFRDLRSLVDFMYQGKLEVSEDRIQDLVDAAECLQIKGLGGGHKEDDLGNINNTTVLPKRPAISSGIPHKRTRKGEHEKTASVGSKENEVNNLNYCNEIRPENSVVITCGASQSSTVQNLRPNSEVQNVAMVSKISLMPAQSRPCYIETDSLHVEDEHVVKRVPDSGRDVHINEPMNRGMDVCGNSGISNGNCGEETILGLSADISVLSEKNIYEDLPSNSVPPTVLSSQLSSRDLTGSFAKNELDNINVCCESVDPVVSAVDIQDPLFHSEFHMKSEDETLLPMDNDLVIVNDELSENRSESIGVPFVSDTQMKCTEKKNDYSGATSECTSESTYPLQKLPAMPVKIRRIGSNEPTLGLMPGLPAEVIPHDSPTHSSHTTPVCERDLPGPSARAVGNGSSSTDQQFRCQICGKTFARNRHLNGHMRIHTEDRSLRNEERNNAAITSIKLNKQRNQSGRKLHKCTLCDFKSVHNTAFTVHMRIHKGLKLFKCTECEYTGADSYLLKRHQRMHSGLKPYECTECNYATTRRFSLKLHQRIHSGWKPYKCMECGYTSTQISNLKTHQRIHSRVKPK